jgi:Flp pilus assembly protein TadG
MKNRKFRRGSHAIEFALIFPIFVVFVMGSIDYFWYLLQRYQVTDAVATGCRTGALTINVPYIDPSTIAAETIIENINKTGNCNPSTCAVTISEEAGPVEDVWLLNCRAQIVYQPLTSLVPMPASLAAVSTQPVKIEEITEE